jgi:glycosyltransferase involved in cell wall biosynthesis
MKIAFLTPEYPNTKTGFAAGIGTSIMNLSKGLLKEGHVVSIVIYGQNKDEKFIDNGIIFHKIKHIKVKGFSRILTQKKIQRLLNSLVSKGEIDIVEAADWTGITSNIKLKCPLVIRLHGSDTYFCHLDKRPVKFINKSRENIALQNADGYLSVSQYTADVTKELFHLQKDFTIIPNGIDLENFSVSQSQNSIHENTILYFGTLIRKKGLLELPLIFNEVYKHNNDAKLVLIGRDASDIISGNSSTWQMMQPLFDAEAMQNVTYLGSVPYDEIKKYINSATVCVFPTFAEALPVSWIEAMAMQKAIVASNIGWATEVIDDSLNGYLVYPKEHKVFAEKVIGLLENEALRIQFGIEAREKVLEKFSIDVVVKQSVLFYETLLIKK